jgi:hypothetical protein
MLRYYYLAWFSQPAADRPLYKLLSQRPVRSIVELGIGEGVRTKRLFELAVQPQGEPLRYTGIDLFEARPRDQAGLTLKRAYSELRTPHVTMQLVPGDPLSALARSANVLRDTDLLIISLDQTGPSLDAAWRFVPRMLHADSLVYLEQPGRKGETRFELLTANEVARRAANAQRAMRHAA